MNGNAWLLDPKDVELLRDTCSAFLDQLCPTDHHAIANVAVRDIRRTLPYDRDTPVVLTTTQWAMLYLVLRWAHKQGHDVPALMEIAETSSREY